MKPIIENPKVLLYDVENLYDNQDILLPYRKKITDIDDMTCRLNRDYNALVFILNVLCSSSWGLKKILKAENK